MQAGLYLLTPIVIKLKNTLTERGYVICGVFLMFWGMGSQVVSDYKLPYALGTVMAFLGYYVLGDILMNIKKTSKPALFYFLIIILFIFATFFVRYKGFQFYIYTTYRNFFSPSIVVYSVCVLMIFKRINIKKDFSRLSGLTFYIYIFHSFILDLVFKFLDPMSNDSNELLMILFATCITFLISLAISFIYKSYWDKADRFKQLWYSFTFWS